MLAYYLNNNPLQLEDDTSVRLTYTNPACNFKDFPGDKGVGIDIPVNDNNRALLGNPHRFEKYVSDNDREFPGFEVRFSGKLLMSGTLIIQDASIESYSGWLRSNLGNMGEAHREKYIYDINAFDQDITFENKANYDPITDAYGCPVIGNAAFFAGKGKKVTGITKVPNPDWYTGSLLPMTIDEPIETEALSEAFRRTTEWLVNCKNTDGTVKVDPDTCKIKEYDTELDVLAVSPMLFLNYVLEELFKDAKFFIDANAIADHADLKKLIIYNNFDITNMSFGEMSEIDQYAEWDSARWEFKSVTRQVGTISRDYTLPFRYKTLLPEIQMKDFIIGLQNMLNVCFHFRHDNKVDIIDREELLEVTPTDIEQYMLGDWDMGEKKDVTLKCSFAHDSKDMMFQERWEDIDDRRDDEGEPVDGWDELISIANPEIGEIRYMKNSNMYVEYALVEKSQTDPADGDSLIEDTLGWQHLTIGFQNGFYNNGKPEEEEIKTKFSTLIGIQNPVVSQPGNINGKRFPYQSFSPRLLFYKGNNIANFETDTLSLDWEKLNTGLLATRYNNWARFWSTRQPATREAMLPLNMLDYVIRKIPYPFRCREGEFIIETLETTIHSNYIGVATLNVYKK